MKLTYTRFAAIFVFAITILASHSSSAQNRSIKNFNSNNVSIIDFTTTGRAWVGTRDAGCGVLAGGVWTTFDSTNTPMRSNNITAICLYPIATVLHSFMGTDQGVAYRHGTTWDSLPGLPDLHVKGIAKSSTDSLWIATGAGVSLYSGAALAHLADLNTSNSNLPFDTISCLQANISASRGFAAGTPAHGFFHTLDGNTYTQTTVASGGLVDDHVNCIYTATGGGTYYVGTKGGLSICSAGCSNYTAASGLPDNDITTITKDCQNRLWIGTRGKGLAVYNGTSFYKIDTTNGLSTNQITSIACDTACSCWIGTADRGIIVIDSSLSRFTAVALPTGITDVDAAVGVHVYPQPASATVTFTIPVTAAAQQLSITDMSGRLVLSQSDLISPQAIHTDGLQSGLYIYHISTADTPLYRGKLLISK